MNEILELFTALFLKIYENRLEVNIICKCFPNFSKILCLVWSERITLNISMTVLKSKISPYLQLVQNWEINYFTLSHMLIHDTLE